MSEVITTAKVRSLREAGLDEKWLQGQIVSNPTILKLGPENLRVYGKERTQESGGRLDILLIDEDNDILYEVETMLGATDESHIIRTIEYWDEERRRCPDKQHIAVLVAETITRRFFNVISLMSMSIPIIAVQMSLVEIGGHEGLLFTKVLDLYRKRIEPTDGEQVVDESYWRKKWPNTLENALAFKGVVEKTLRDVKLHYAKWYICLKTSSYKGNNFWFSPKAGGEKTRIEFWVDDEHYIEDIKNLLNKNDVDFNYKNDQFRFTVGKSIIVSKPELFEKLAEYSKETSDQTS